MKKSLILLWVLCLAGLASAQSGKPATVADVRALIDPASGAAKDTTTVFSLDAIVTARLTLADGKVLAFIQPVGKIGLPVLASAAEASKFLPRNELTLSGQLQAGPFGWAVLAVQDGSVTVQGDNKPFGASVPVSASFFSDASTLAGKFIQVTNVTFVSSKIDVKGGVKVKDDSGATVDLVLAPAADGRTAPTDAENVFGVPIKVNGAWKLLAARFLPVTGKATLAMAEKYTCTSCHNPDLKVVGPAYRDVADKYKDDNDAITKFMAQMESGGSGKWGQVPMPPFKDKVPPADEKTIATWIWGYRWDWILAE